MNKGKQSKNDASAFGPVQDGEALDQDGRIIPDASVESLMHFRMRTPRQ